MHVIVLESEVTGCLREEKDKYLAALLTQVKMEKKENAMAARAASVPSFIGLSSGFETRHWSARKQKLTNQRNAHKP